MLSGLASLNTPAWIISREWALVLDVHPTAVRPDCLRGYAWLQFPDRVREVHRHFLEFWYDPPGCALTDEELALLRRIAARRTSR